MCIVYLSTGPIRPPRFPSVGTPSCRAAAALDATEGTGAAGAGATPVATSRTRGVATGGTGFSVPNSWDGWNPEKPRYLLIHQKNHVGALGDLKLLPQFQQQSAWSQLLRSFGLSSFGCLWFQRLRSESGDATANQTPFEAANVKQKKQLITQKETVSNFQKCWILAILSMMLWITSLFDPCLCTCLVGACCSHHCSCCCGEPSYLHLFLFLILAVTVRTQQAGHGLNKGKQWNTTKTQQKLNTKSCKQKWTTKTQLTLPLAWPLQPLNSAVLELPAPETHKRVKPWEKTV